jgi:hypothetical protein
LPRCRSFRPAECRTPWLGGESAIRSLLLEVYEVAPRHSMLEGRHLHWKYWEPRADWQGSPSYVLTRQDRIIAHTAIVPAACRWGNERLKLLHVIDRAAIRVQMLDHDTAYRHGGSRTFWV